LRTPLLPPKQRQAAIEVVEEDITFTAPEQVKVWSLFYKDIAAADTYMAITDERKRNRFVRGLLDMPVNEPDNLSFYLLPLVFRTGCDIGCYGVGDAYVYFNFTLFKPDI
jgi:hypothetical protein